MYVCIANIYIKGGRGSTDLTKYYRYVTGKSILCYIACAWDCHSLHEAPPVFQRNIAPQKDSDRSVYLLPMVASLMIS